MADHYTAQQFIDAIPGSGGIITHIAARVGCSWHTAKKYCATYATVKRALENERSRVLDMAESVIINNIEAIYRQIVEAQKRRDPKVAEETADIKWYLAMKGAQRGYAPKQRLDLTSDDKPLEATKIIVREYVSDEKGD
jgi:hypothetical protein